jgi:hypothetical protein
MNNLTNLVKDVTYFYIKYYYEQELEKTKQKKLQESDLKQLIDNLYVEKLKIIEDKKKEDEAKANTK